MRVLVAGSAGFIGCHLAKRFLDDGHQVVGVDNIVTGQKSNIEHLQGNEAFTFIRHDIVEPLTVDGRFDLICNLACPASPVDFGPLSIEIMDVCSRGTRALLDLARQNEAVYLHASTSEVYGDPKVHPQPESYWGHVNSIGPRSCYDEGKRFGEALTVAYRDRYALRTRMARIFNTYGPRMRANDGRALPVFINQALSGQPITVHGDGAQTRSFCFVSDLVDGLVRLSASEFADPVNLGNPHEISILDIAKEVIEIAASASEIVLVDRPADDPQVRRPDITRAAEILGWKPIVERRDGLAVTVEWFRSVAQPPPAVLDL